jgi:anti-sigma regulatory factor (Ser/Thr protein kinase)
MEKAFERRLESLSAVFAFLKEASATLELDAGMSFSVNMAVEELFTNMIKYGASGEREILIGIDKSESQLKIKLVDYDSEPFDLTDLDSVDTSAPLNQRRPGGLGIHLVKCIMDEVRYEYKNRTTHISLAKNL